MMSGVCPTMTALANKIYLRFEEAIQYKHFKICQQGDKLRTYIKLFDKRAC